MNLFAQQQNKSLFSELTQKMYTFRTLLSFTRVGKGLDLLFEDLSSKLSCCSGNNQGRRFPLNVSDNKLNSMPLQAAFFPRIQSFSLVYRRWVCRSFTAIAKAFFSPMITTSFLPRVNPV